MPIPRTTGSTPPGHTHDAEVRPRGAGAAEHRTAIDAWMGRGERRAPSPATVEPPSPSSTSSWPALRLRASVGRGQRNHAADVRKLQQRLADLGFDVGVDGRYGRRTSPRACADDRNGAPSRRRIPCT